MARVTRIRDLQELLGFSLAEVRVVLDTADIDALDRLRSEFRWGEAGPDRRRALLAEAVEANDRLLTRLDETLARIQAFRDEQAAKSERLGLLLTELDAPTGPETG
jgi:DNA-binding transcriptional MerR regulator